MLIKKIIALSFFALLIIQCEKFVSYEHTSICILLFFLENNLAGKWFVIEENE